MVKLVVLSGRPELSNYISKIFLLTVKKPVILTHKTEFTSVSPWKKFHSNKKKLKYNLTNEKKRNTLPLACCFRLQTTKPQKLIQNEKRNEINCGSNIH